MRVEILGVAFDNITMDEAVERAVALMAQPGPHLVVTPNAEIVQLAEKDEEFSRIIAGADLVIPDGVGVIYASRILGRPLKGRVPGVDFAAALMDRMAAEGKKLFLLGAKPGVAEEAAQRLAEAHPGLTVCGTHDGYFTEDEPVTAAIRQSGAEVVFVCLGAPKQERFMAAHKEELNVGLMIGLGGSLDGFAGTVKRAPKWMIRCNLEWLYRLIKEPRRLGRMMRLPKFVRACKKQRRREGKHHG